MALPLNTWHLPHHAEPCQSPAVGALPWLPPLPGLEPPPESALGFLLGGGSPSCSGKGDPFLLWEGRLSFRTPGSPPSLLWGRDNAQPEKDGECKVPCLLFSTREA